MLHKIARDWIPAEWPPNAMAAAGSEPNWKPYNEPRALAVFGITIALFVLVITSIRYTLSVVTALTMVETPRTSYLVSDEKTIDAKDPEVLVIKEVPITPNIRRTVRYLVSRGGALARWRGAAVIITYSLAYYLISELWTVFSSPLPHSRPALHAIAIHMVTGIITDLLLARLAATWTHVVISEPSSKSWYSRVPPARTWKKLAVPTAVRSFCLQLTGYLPALLATQVYDNTDFEDKEWMHKMAPLYLCIVVIGFMTFIGLYIPSEVSLTRVQASLLPDDVETIVNVDRTFNGRVVPEILGGSGCVSFMGAWKSFDGPARVRLLRLFAKIFIIEVSLHAWLAIILVLEVYMMGKFGNQGGQAPPVSLN